jgi:hypothetical protein
VSSTIGVNVLVGWLWCSLEPRAGRLGGRGRGRSTGRELARVRVGTLLKMALLVEGLDRDFKFQMHNSRCV